MSRLSFTGYEPIPFQFDLAPADPFPANRSASAYLDTPLSSHRSFQKEPEHPVCGSTFSALQPAAGNVSRRPA
jgi:hypothetical protein